MSLRTTTALVCLIGSGATAGEQTYSDLATAANNIMDQVNLSRTLMKGASYYAGVGGIAPDGSVTQAQLDAAMVDAYNTAYQGVLDATYYNTQMLLQDQHDIAMDNLATSIDALVDATATFATVGAVAEMAADASVGTVDDQLQAQAALEQTDMTITETDVAEYNAAVQDVEKYAQEAAGFLAASTNTQITATSDEWAKTNNVSVVTYTSVTYDATNDLLFMSFANEANGCMSVSFQNYLQNEFKTADDIYNTGIAYGG